MSIEMPADVIQRQLNAYNSKDVEGWLGTYAHDAEQYSLHGERLAQGHAEMRSRITSRFLEPDLHAKLVSRTVTVVVNKDVASSHAACISASA